MELNISTEWLRKAAEMEAGRCISAGGFWYRNMNMLSDTDLLAMAVCFNVGPEAFINGYRTYMKDGKWSCGNNLEVKQSHCCEVRWTGSKWVICNGMHFCLTKSGTWEYTSIPSEISEDYKNRTRWDDLREAIRFFERHRQWEWEIHDELGGLDGRELWDEMEKRLQGRYKENAAQILGESVD